MKAVRIYYLIIGLFILAGCNKPMVPVKQESRHYAVSKQGVDSAMAQMIAPYRQQMDEQMEEVIGRADTTLYKAQPECTIGNFVADALLQKAKTINSGVDVSVMNYGGIRIPYIQPGAIVVRQIYELMPFDNMLCMVEMKGSVLKQFCNHMAALKGWPVSGMSYKITVGKEAIDIRVNGQPIEEGKTYLVVTNDYVANGGDNCSFLIPLQKQQTNIFIRDVLITYIKKLKGTPLHIQTENRVAYAE